MSDDRDDLLPLGPVAGVVDEYERAGGVVEYALVRRRPGPADDQLHASAAVAGLLEFARRHASRVADRAAELGLATDDVGRIETRADAAVGRRVSAEDFVGRCWDWHRGQLIWPYREGPNGRVRGWGGTTSVTSGYADAFMDPPYGMRATFDQVGAWFDTINEHLLGGLAADLVVYDWSGTWSTYFDAGREWWGSFLWTVEPAARQWIAVIGASSTD